MSETQIILRHDTPDNWSASGATDIKKGELAFEIEEEEIEGVGTVYRALGRLGVDSQGEAFGLCPLVVAGAVIARSESNPEGVGYTFTEPVVYEDIAVKPDGTTVRWDADALKWIADAQVVTIDAYPTEDGTVVYDAAAEKFTVGAVVTASEIDGGDY